MNKALDFFFYDIERTQYVQARDTHACRMLGGIYASIIVAEEYFRQFGSIHIKDGKMQFTELHKQYTKMVSQLNSGLATMGLTPVGRQLLNESRDVGVSSAFEKYISEKVRDVEYTVTDDRPKETDQHNRVLPGPEAVESPAPGHTGSPAEEDIRPTDDEGSGEAVLQNDGEGGGVADVLESRKGWDPFSGSGFDSG